MRNKLTMVFAAGLILSGLTVGSQAAELKLHGSSTVGKNIVVPHQPAIEGAAGVTLAVVMNGSGNGLKDLAAGRADLAMISAPIEVEQALANAKDPGSLDIAGMQTHPVGASKIYFIVNPKNGAKALDAAQIRGLLSGEVTDWKDVGGTPGPVLVAIEAPGNGTRAMISHAFMEGAEYAAAARVVPALAQVAQIVAQAPNAIGYGNDSSIKEGAVAVIAGTEVDQPLSLVTKGDPTPDQQKLIDAAAAAGRGK